MARVSSLASSLSSHISLPPPDINPSLSNRRQCLIYLIPGNPGLIDYYYPFLTTLRDLLDHDDAGTHPHNVSYHIYGQTLAGFVDDSHSPFTTKEPPYDVEDQVKHVLHSLTSMRITSPEHRKDEPFDDVMLMGHSLGAYIALKIIEILRHTPSSPSISSSPYVNLKSCILLFPTIADIALSSSGKHLYRLSHTGVIGNNVWRAAKMLLWPWPESFLRFLCRYLLGQPEHAARVTARWLSSRDGVWESLFLGMDEMNVIGEEKWGKGLWEDVLEDDAAVDTSDKAAEESDPGVGGMDGAMESKVDRQVSDETQGLKAPKFVLFFGKKDPWIADKLRDKFIQERLDVATKALGGAARTKIIVDDGKITHAFCVDNSEIVAEKTKTWIEELTEPSLMRRPG